MHYELCITLAFQRLTFNHPQAAIELLRTVGGAEAVYAHRKDIKAIIPDATDTLCRLLNVDWDPVLEWAKTEIEWCEKKNIRILVAGTPEYPQRLLSCPDAPITLFQLGSLDLNASHIISIVGTRQSTLYGQDALHRIISDLKRKVPDLVVVSGLAYGIDVCAHKEALAADLPTLGVVAHGLDTLYPATHRNIAVRMLEQGGLLTEYPSQTKGDKQNFLRRNRIVAGISDCTIVAESMSHGGSLVTARIAADYHREVFAIPGRLGDKASEGCNRLIQTSKASMLLSADDIIETLGWHTVEEINRERSQGIQTSLFTSLSAEQRLVADALKDNDLQLNVISINTGIPISKVSSLLFEMEMLGIIKAYAGGMYHLING